MTIKINVQLASVLLKNNRELANVHYDHADAFSRDSASKRDKLALEAATDHRGRAEELVNKFRETDDINVMVEILQEHRDHAQYWSNQFTGWGGHDHEYAGGVHRKAAVR